MTDRDALADRLDAVEADLAPEDAGPLFALVDGDGYVTPAGDPVPTDADGEPAPGGSGPIFVLPPEVTDYWGRADDDARGGT